MTKPVIIAIAGPSASGKDSLARSLTTYLQRQKYWRRITNSAHLIVSDTTRPKRRNEHDGFDYFFIGTAEFLRRDAAHEYIDTYVYGPQRWHYGTLKSQLKAEINIGVFSPSGIDGLYERCGDAYTVVPVLLDAPKLTRLWRSVKRDGRLTFEHLRRLRSDTEDFARFDVHHAEVIDLRRRKLSVDETMLKVYNILCVRGIVTTT